MKYLLLLILLAACSTDPTGFNLRAKKDHWEQKEQERFDNRVEQITDELQKSTYLLVWNTETIREALDALVLKEYKRLGFPTLDAILQAEKYYYPDTVVSFKIYNSDGDIVYDSRSISAR